MFKKIKSLVINVFEKMNIVRGPINKSDRAGMLYKAWGYVFTNQLSGDYVEFGVYQGNSLITSYQEHAKFKKWLNGQMISDEDWRRESASNFIEHKVKFHALDSFKGMPSNNEENVTFKKGSFISDVEKVKDSCRKVGLKEDDNFIIYEGFFTDTSPLLIKNLKGRKISILNIDSDIYLSAKNALEVSAPFLDIGSIILFDDYNCFAASNNEGERKAFKEFQLESDLIWESWMQYHFVGQAFLCVDRKKSIKLK